MTRNFCRKISQIKLGIKFLIFRLFKFSWSVGLENNFLIKRLIFLTRYGYLCSETSLGIQESQFLLIFPARNDSKTLAFSNLTSLQNFNFTTGFSNSGLRDPRRQVSIGVGTTNLPKVAPLDSPRLLHLATSHTMTCFTGICLFHSRVGTQLFTSITFTNSSKLAENAKISPSLQLSSPGYTHDGQS